MRHPVILFDGVCTLCNGAVQFVIKRDPGGYFRFAALDSAAARTILAECDVINLPDSVVLIEDGQVYTRSTAALRIARRLSFPWPMLSVLRIVPRALRDWIYDIIAQHRYQWFGRRDVCMVPTAELKARFLE